jgi:hypothetical protein
MSDLRALLNGLEPSLALKFFATFARLEFAMKYAGCLTATDNAGVALASRSLLSQRLPSDFFEKVLASGVAEALFDEPPKNLFREG